MDAKNSYLVPVAILLSGLVLAITIYTVRTGGPTAVVPEGNPSLVRPVGVTDHILGSPEAPVKLVEYSDMDCEYCKKYHEVLAQLMTEYAPLGKVAWVYRHFPIVAENPDSGTHAKAAECAAELGGENIFWRFIDMLAASAPSASRFDPAEYSSLAKTLGISSDALSECIQSDRFSKKVAADFENALVLGAEGAPYTLILIEGAEPIPVSGYLPYEDMKQVIETALGKLPQ